MIAPVCFALFCEDIRREGNGRDTIIGVMPAAIRVSKFPGALRRFSVYYRIRLPLDHDPSERIFINLDADGVSDVQIVDEDGLSAESLERLIARTKRQKAPHVEINARLRLDDFPLIGAGQIRAVAIVGEQKLVGGFINVELRDDATASQQPSEQSRCDARDS
ncbi:hypothetical protein HAP48_0042275 [Bradyrhizobium septentrionale]|uniref:Uncharacterized protein n=1 Tax=Bradyrhizobium septentrionale TaxID=1404411 RepID=A0A973W3C5_9BRAD|nr:MULTISPECIES: hypothetical protein [Bradyrhizobium]MCK7669829.1 hypothetical protein [Bradyrhizobium sp. 2S1]UGY15087.1 hypothetical protein HAP48_0042275 [Bradyrhizobium septentrionale]